MILKHLTGLSMALNTPDVRLSRVGAPADSGNPLCRLVRKTPDGMRRCEACDRRQQALAGSSGKARLYVCHAGFYDIAIPIRVQGELVATISSGQILTEPPSAAAFRRLHQHLRPLNIPEAQLQKAYRRAPWLSRVCLRHVMRLLALFAQQICANAWRTRELENEREKPFIHKARVVVERRFRDPEFRLAEAATAAGLSVAYFSHAFHKKTGVTFTRYVQSCRIEQAKRLLADSKSSITDICFACGFNSLTHFNRVFKRGEGCSPNHWRTSR